MCVALQYALRDGRLGTRGIDRHHSPLYVKPVEQAGYGRYLVLLVRSGSGDQRATDMEIAAMYRDQAFGTQSEKRVDVELLQT